MFRGDILGYLLRVIGLISRFRAGDGPRLAIKPCVAHGDRLAEEPDLVPSVVEVVLPRDVPAGGLHDPGQRVPVGRLTSVPNMHRPRRVDAHELEQYGVSGRLSPSVQITLTE